MLRGRFRRLLAVDRRTPRSASSQCRDFVLLPSGEPFLLYSAPEAPAVDAYPFFHTVPAGEIAVLNGGGGCSGVGGGFGFGERSVELLLGVLPPLVHIRKEEDKAGLRWFIERLMRELREPQPGSSLIAEHLAQTLLGRGAAPAPGRALGKKHRLAVRVGGPAAGERLYKH